MDARIRIESWNIEVAVKALDDETYIRLWRALRLYWPDIQQNKEDFKFDFSWPVEFVIDLATTGEALVNAGIQFKIVRFASCYKVAQPDRTVNLQVAIPNLALFAVTEVRVVQDNCTDALQMDLDEGWRILAVCPPAAQRRPDYILGRSPETAARATR